MGNSKQLQFILPKGRIQAKVIKILTRIGLEFSIDDRSYRPGCNDPDISVKLLKPQNIPSLVSLGRHDCGFTGYDWIVEQDAEVEELIDLGFDPVELVAAVPDELAVNDEWKNRRLVVASEYRNLAKKFIAKNDLNAVYLQTYGATEAMPPEDADLIIDNTATGATLRRNRLTVVNSFMRSTTRFICNRETLEIPWKRKRLEEIQTIINSALLADRRVLLEMNVDNDRFDNVIEILPCMRSPTVSPLHNEAGFAVKAAVPVKDVPKLIPDLIQAGARDILEYKLEKIVDTAKVNGEQP